MREWEVDYIDVLRWALGRSDQSRFSGDTTAWHRFVLRAKDQYPELFKYVTFDQRDPERPYSEQAEHALHVLAQSGIVTKGNPSFRFMWMDDEQRRAALERNQARLADYEMVVTNLAALVPKELAP